MPCVPCGTSCGTVGSHTVASEFVFQLDPARLRIEDRKSGAHLEFPNRIVVNKRRGLILAIGESEDVVRSRFGDRFPAEDVGTLTLFGPAGAFLSYELRVIGHLMRLLADHAHGRSVTLVPSKPPKGSDYAFDIPGYETFSESRRRSFEHAVQAYFRVRRLTINEHDLAIPAQRREIEIQVRRLLVMGLPAAAAIAGFLAAPAALREDRFVFLIYVLAILLVSYYGGSVEWMLLARRILPVDYCFYMLQHGRGRFSPIDQWLAKTFWRNSSPD